MIMIDSCGTVHYLEEMVATPDQRISKHEFNDLPIYPGKPNDYVNLNI